MNGPGMISMNAAGGPVGGGPVINQAAARQEMNKEDQKRLNTYIYDYLLKNEQYDLARIFHQKFPILAAPVNIKSSPGKRDVNGVDEMDTDSKDALKRPQDLPEPNIPSHGDGSCFLFDWWCQFWEIYGARNSRSGGTPTADYLQHNITQQRARAQGQQRLLQQNDQRMMGMQGYNNLMMQQNPAMMNEMAKQRAAAMGQRNATPQQLQQMQQHKLMANQMQRDGSGMDMGGQRPQSPMGNTPSPSKRPRLDDGSGFGGQPMGPAGRGQSMSGPQMNNMAAAAGPNAPGQMLLQNGINPDLQQQQMAAFSSAPNMQPKLEAMNANGIPQPNQMGGQMDGSMDFNINAQRAAAGGASQSGGNHALQDYQMQLMLLEQQNKKRLLMARQEQDNISNHPGQVPQAGANYMAPAMSPSGSRAGPSPGPNEQMRKGPAGTPKMGGPGVPGSPMPDMGQNRASPAPNFDPGQIPPGMNPQYYAQMSNNMMGQPPSSHPRFNIAMANMNPQQMEQMRMSGRIPNGAPWPQGGPQQMIQQQPGQQQPGPNQPQMGTPQQARGNMPPPPAPASQEQQQRTQPSSPAQQGQAPPTPSQAPKSNPKGKKEGAAKAAKKQKNPPKKAGATGATPAAENAEPPTPTPSTPITPMHPNSFNKAQNGNAPQPPPNQQQPPAQPPPAPAPAAPPVAEPPMAMDANASFGMFEEGGDTAFNLDFNMNMDSSDVLDSFDFDSLLNPDGFSFGNEGGLEVQ